MSMLSWILLLAVIAFFIFIAIKFRKTRMLSNFPFQPDEKILFEEKPIKLEQGVYQSNTSIGMTGGGGIAVNTQGPRRTRIIRPWIRITSKNIIIVQKKEEKPDGPIYCVLSFSSTENEKLTWWKQGYVTMPINVSEIRAVSNSDGSYRIEIPLPSMVPAIIPMQNVQQFTKIWTNQLGQYEKALHTKIEVKSE